MGKLEGKVAIITGGASGMGKEMVDLFKNEGAFVIAADVNEEGLKAVEQEANVEGVKLDVSSDEDWKHAVENIKERHGKIDILVNNAGITTEKSADDTTVEDWELMMRINSYGPFAGIKHVAPYMAENGKGSIVNISSFTAQIGLGFNSYSASKGAVRAVSKSASTTYGKQGVRVNAVFPGVIETPMTKNLKESGGMLEQLEKATPLGRLGKSEDIAKAVLFLASDDADYITGAELVIDGGFSAQ
ncbi:tungsten formylmethanofuran dehydrogenase [Salimicrobium jeotgali]|uniref:Cyclopentanol dehydrogenase n=1 Tax=Salimicrobium jeotgali TaxID=1230341 RepID=K2GNT5_9BACI|nr:SDR family oxidoreductase [Salimicrobium jeotgali]AKG03554.1 tungsten formylmethanofuran dehydrogenase [Salimicrobium jeotgali]EKE32044.1 cyclopentanol dehydrogenase [Salimicrobium jeotgali]MBM7696011.1 NAD(P)-dependent dehydrogenase (short-subunit alcohol dehydrogenase family) [Salimicrobium jeotgali]